MIKTLSVVTGAHEVIGSLIIVPGYGEFRLITRQKKMLMKYLTNVIVSLAVYGA